MPKEKELRVILCHPPSVRDGSSLPHLAQRWSLVVIRACMSVTSTLARWTSVDMGLTLYPFVVIVISVVAALLVEGVSWLLVYRTTAYRRLKEELDRSSKKLEALKSTSPAAAVAKPKKNKKEQRLEDNVRSTNRDLATTKMKTGTVQLL